MKYYAVGRRKSSVAKIYILCNNKTEYNNLDKFVINDKNIYDYFQKDQRLIESIKQIILNLDKKLELVIKVTGGGVSSQKDAIILALTRAICKIDNSLYSIFKRKGLLTQDSRVKERKKYGLKKARKAPQYSKR